MVHWLPSSLLFGLSCSLGLWLYGSSAFSLALWLSGSRKELFEYSQRVLGVIVHLSHLRLREETKAEAEQKYDFQIDLPFLA